MWEDIFEYFGSDSADYVQAASDAVGAESELVAALNAADEVGTVFDTGDGYGGSVTMDGFDNQFGGDVTTSYADLTSPDWQPYGANLGNDNYPGATGDVTAGDASKPAGMVDRIQKMVKENQALTQMLLKGVGGAVAQSNKAKSDAALLQMRGEIEAAAVAEKRKQNSASVMGLKPISTTGLIGGLKRTTGQNVFKNGLMGAQ